MRRIRVAYLAVLVLFVFLAQLSSRRELYLLVVIALAVPVMALLLHIYTCCTIRLEPVFTKAQATKGDQIFFLVKVHNRSFIPYANAGIFLRLPYLEKETEMRCTVPPRTTSGIRVPVSCLYCGSYSGGVTRIRINDLFGFFTFPLPNRNLQRIPGANLIVLPHVTELAPYALNRESIEYREQPSLNLADLGDSFSDIRAYRAGDSIKRIHWPAAARQRELLVRVYDAPKGSAIIIFIDNTDAYYQGRELLLYSDLACECAASIAKAASLSGFSATVISRCVRSVRNAQSFTVNPADSRGLTMLLHHLVRLPFTTEENTCKFPELQAPAQSHTKAVFVLSGVQNSDLYKRVRVLFPHHSTPVKQLLLGHEKSTADSTSGMLPVAFHENLDVSLGGRIWE